MRVGVDDAPYDELDRQWEIARDEASRWARSRRPPEAVAVAIADAIECEEPKLRWPVGADADLVLPIRAAMDDEAFEQTMRSVLELEW